MEEDKIKKEVLRRLKVILSKADARWEKQTDNERIDDIDWIKAPIITGDVFAGI